MLLKLIPTKNEPTIHFSLSFGDLPPQLPAPVSWTAQLSQLMHEDLEVPATLHSLDRATGVSSLLEEVAIDVEAREVRCLFVDGCMERISFGLHGKKHEQALMAAVASIIRDVRESTVEDQQVAKQRDWEKEREKVVSVVNVPVTSAPPPAKPGRQGKHKKQRSLFMHIVSSIGSIITPSTSSNANHSLQNRQRTAGYRNSTSVIPSATTALASPTLPTPGSSPRARALRRAARSALVDTYRRFILDELVRRFYAGPQPPGAREGDVPSMYGLENHHRRERGGFCVWILHSMRRRALIRMDQLLDEAGPAPQEVTHFSEECIPAVCSTTMDVPLSFSDEEDEDGLVDVPLVDSEAHKSSSVDETPRAESQLTSPATSRDDLPPLPDASRRASSSSSVGTEDSSDSEATSRSSSSMSCASTAPSSVDSEPEMKDDTSAELPLTLHLPQYSPRRSSGLSHIHHLSPSARHEYTQLAALRMRLNQLLLFSTSQSRVVSEEIRGRLDMLAVRSRRRAWLNKALKTPLAGASGYISAGGGLMLGLATPFRSSPLARYVLTAEDVARRQSSISRSSACSSTSSLSSAYFRSVSASSSATSLPPSPTAPPVKVSFTPFPTSRPRIRPKLDHGALTALTVVEFSDSEIQDDAMESINDEGQDGLVITTREEMVEAEEEEEADRLDFEAYQEDMVRTHAPARTRRHRRSMQEPMMPALPLPSIETRAAGGPDARTGQDEQMGGNNELTLALLARGHAPTQRGRKSSIPVAKADSEPATFLGCAEVAYTDAQDGQDDVAGQDIVFALEAGGPTPPSTLTDISTTFAADSAPHTRPATRVRTSSMVGALLRGAKGVQRSIVGGLKPQAPLQACGPLNADSLLCQPVSVPGVPQPPIVVPSSNPTKLAHGHSAAAPVHACNRRAMDLARPPVAASLYANVDVEMNDVEVNVHLRINDFDASYGAKAGAVVPTPSLPAGEFEQELQKQQTCFAQEQEFTLAMDVAPRGRGVAGGKRWRSRSQGQYQEDASRRPKLTTVFGDGQSALR